jgi:hypothetical protein
MGDSALTRQNIPRRQTLGDGHVDEVAQALDGLAAEVSDQDKTALASALKPPTSDLVRRMQQANTGLHLLRDDAQALWLARSHLLKEITKRQIEAIRAAGLADQQRIDIETKEVGDRMARDTIAEVMAVNEEPAGKLAADVSAAGIALGEKIEERRANEDAPSPVQLEDLALAQAWRARIMGQDNPLKYAIRKFEEYAKCDNRERLRVLLPVLEELSNSALEDPGKFTIRVKNKQMATHSRNYSMDGSDSPILLAKDLNRSIREYRATTEDPWLAFADGVLARCRDIFKALFGADPRFLSSEAFARRYYSVDGERPVERREEPPDSGRVGA